jgi:hypothetical protein
MVAIQCPEIQMLEQDYGTSTYTAWLLLNLEGQIQAQRCKPGVQKSYSLVESASQTGCSQAELFESDFLLFPAASHWFPREYLEKKFKLTIAHSRN